MNEPLISIIIPIYNVEKFLPKCLDSVINQNYKNIEIILIDDGSTDNSLIVCKSYASKDTRIKVISQENKGVSIARNHGIKFAFGEYISFVDGDDIVAQNLISRMLLAMNSCKVDLVSVGYTRNVNNLGNTKKTYIKLYDRFNALKDFSYNEAISFSVWGKLYKTEIVKQILFDDKTGIYEDYLFVCNYIAKSNVVLSMNDKLYCYVKRNGSALNNNFSPKCIEMIYSYEKSFELIKNISNDLIPFFRCSYLYDLILLKENMINNKSDKYFPLVDEKINQLKTYYLKGSKKKRFFVLLYKINQGFYLMFNAFYTLLKSYIRKWGLY